MDVRRYQSGPDLLAAIGPLLSKKEPEHSLLLGFAQAERPFAGCEIALAAFAGDSPQAVLLQTSINEAIVSTGPAQAARALGHALAEVGTNSRGIVGPAPAADAATVAFAERAGVSTRVERRLQLHRLAGHPRANLASESLCEAEAQHRALLVEWSAGFERDTQTPEHTRKAEQRVQQGMEAGRLFVLCPDGESGVARPVAAASWGRPTTNTKTISCVYTPPEERGRGYGRAVTALLAQHLLGLGTRDILLFTDADDPTPNRMYARVGFEPIAEFTHWAFD